MRRLIHKLWAKFLTLFGNIKIFKFPLFFVYDPSEFKMDGPHTFKALNLLQPGDIVLRGYDNYLDGYFIDDRLSYSHGAIYVGDNTIIHAVAEGVSKINALDFMKCDRICILRPKSGMKKAIALAYKFLADNVPYDFNFKEGASALYCFELCALCYPQFNILKIQVKKFFGLVKKDAYLANSFRKNPNFKLVFEYNKKHHIDK